MSLIQIAGAIIIGLVMCQLLLLGLSSVRRLLDEQRRSRLGLELLNQQLAMATWQRQQKEQTQHLWEGWRKFVVQRKVEEARDISSVYLTPHDGRPLPPYQPGQF